MGTRCREKNSKKAAAVNDDYSGQLQSCLLWKLLTSVAGRRHGAAVGWAGGDPFQVIGQWRVDVQLPGQPCQRGAVNAYGGNASLNVRMLMYSIINSLHGSLYRR